MERSGCSLDKMKTATQSDMPCNLQQLRCEVGQVIVLLGQLQRAQEAISSRAHRRVAACHQRSILLALIPRRESSRGTQGTCFTSSSLEIPRPLSFSTAASSSAVSLLEKRYVYSSSRPRKLSGVQSASLSMIVWGLTAPGLECLRVRTL